MKYEPSKDQYEDEFGFPLITKTMVNCIDEKLWQNYLNRLREVK